MSTEPREQRDVSPCIHTLITLFLSNLDPANAKVAVCEALVLREDLLAEYLVGERDVFFGHLEKGVHVAPVEVVQRLVNAGY